MKTLKEIRKEIKSELDYLESKDFRDLDYKSQKSMRGKADKRVEFLRVIEKYLEHTPAENFCQSELNRLNARLFTIENSYGSFIPKFPDKKKAEFSKEHDLPLLKTQIKTLQYILS